MSETMRALLLVGSPRPKSTSHSLGAYLLERLQEKGFETEEQRLIGAIREPDGLPILCRQVDGADLVILSFPVYVDGLPALATEALEAIARHRAAVPARKQQRFIAISQCGFPEVAHNEVAVAICRRFALDTGFEWAGALAMGGGAAIDGRPLDQAGGMARGARAALALAAEDLAQGEAIGEGAVSMMAKPMVSGWLYTFMGNLGWWRQARRHQVAGHLGDRPYARG